MMVTEALKRTLALLFAAWVVYGQDSCSSEKETECAGQNRTCADEECGDCVEGQIPIFGYCVIPEEIDFDKFQEALEPYLSFEEGKGVCDEAGNTTCADEFRWCINTEGELPSPSCENCFNGYIEYEEECILIDSINFTAFVETFEPLYPELELSNEERAQLLEFLARFISALEGLMPPLPFSLGLNKLSADTKEEYEKLLGTGIRDGGLEEFGFGRFDPSRRSLQELPSKVDWAEMGKLTEVKDQGRCGSCWAVSLMASIEGAACINSEFCDVDLSFQQLISCDDNNNGCNGGNIIYAMGYSWLNEFGGVTQLSQYPYTDKQGSTTEECKLDGKNLSVALKEPQVVTSVNDDTTFQERFDIMKLAVSFQPVTMVLKSNCNTFQSYRSGILTDDGGCFCEETRCIDHAVVIVGYNDDHSIPYWKLRNSWGTGWGEDGYFRIAQEGGGRWGLFGMLAESVIPLETSNSTIERTSGAIPTRWAWLTAVGSIALGLIHL